jgi:hypothetical protein
MEEDPRRGHGALAIGGLPCEERVFGAPVHDDESGHTFQFTGMSFDDGLADAYTENFPPGTTIAEAKGDVMKTMPKDAAITSFVVGTVGGSCGWITVSSPTLAKLLSTPKIGDPQGVIGVEFTYTNANLDVVYNPNNIQDAAVSTLPVDPAGGC